jgi:hypothetical protein
MAKVIAMPPRDEKPLTPWSALGFDTERDMLLDDFKALNKRLKDPDTPAHAIAALSKRKTEVFEQIKTLDAGDDDTDILDDSEDEAWDISG